MMALTQRELDEQLNSACCDGRLDDARSVYEMGANPNWQDPRLLGYTALIWAANGGQTDVVKYLVEETTAQVNATNKFSSWTACHHAARDGHLEVVKLLVAHGANLQLRDKYGRTPLDLARQRDHQPIVDYLTNDDHHQAVSSLPSPSPSSLSKNKSKAASIGATGLHNRNLMERHMQQQGSVDLLSLKSFFIGPSCVGKTTARRRLTYEITHISPDEIVPSTGIDAPLTVQLYHETDRSSVLLSEEGWRSLGIKEQCQTLCSHVISIPAAHFKPPPLPSRIARRAKTKPRFKLFGHRKKAKENQYITAPTLKATTSVDEPIVMPTHGLATARPTTIQPLIDKSKDKPTDDLTDLIAALATLVKDEDWESIQELLKERTILAFLHIIDIGGQPECHEILPLLLHGLALNLIFLNVTQDLDSPYTVVYRTDSGYSPIQYKSEFTIREIVQRALCSIASLQTCPDHKPAAILVGTYFDQSSEEAVFALDQSIQKAFKDTNFMKNDILCPVSEPEEKERYIHPLDNVSGDPSDIDKLRQLITTIVHQRFTPVPVPTSTLLLHLILRQRFEVRG